MVVPAVPAIRFRALKTAADPRRSGADIHRDGAGLVAAQRTQRPGSLDILLSICMGQSGALKIIKSA
jgi:hypothetical protein